MWLTIRSLIPVQLWSASDFSFARCNRQTNAIGTDSPADVLWPTLDGSAVKRRERKKERGRERKKGEKKER